MADSLSFRKLNVVVTHLTNHITITYETIREFTPYSYCLCKYNY